MDLAIIDCKTLSTEMIQAWKTLQQDNPSLSSPFFCPEFAQTIGTFRNDIRVAILKEKDTISSFFPFRLTAHNIAKPLPMCDYQGIIARQGVRLNILALLKACALTAWDFEQLIFTEDLLGYANYATITEIKTIDLSKDYSDYEHFMKRNESSVFDSLHRKMRKLEREIGAIRFEPDIRDRNILHTLLRWKEAKYNKGRPFDDWALKTFETLFDLQRENFSSVLSCLYAGENLLAAHFGLRSKKILHWWFPAYNQAYGKYSPGALLLLLMIKSFSSSVNTLDLGAGDEAYKNHFSNNKIPVACGSFELASMVTLRRRVVKNFKHALNKTPTLKKLFKRIYAKFCKT